MLVVNTETLYHRKKSPDKILHMIEEEKKKKYLEACLQKRYHFSPFVISVDSLLGVEAEATVKCIAICLVTKWKQPYSRTCVYIKNRVTITLARSTHHCIRGSWVMANNISVQHLQWY